MYTPIHPYLSLVATTHRLRLCGLFCRCCLFLLIRFLCIIVITATTVLCLLGGQSSSLGI